MVNKENSRGHLSIQPPTHTRCISLNEYSCFPLKFPLFFTCTSNIIFLYRYCVDGTSRLSGLSKEIVGRACGLLPQFSWIWGRQISVHTVDWLPMMMMVVVVVVDLLWLWLNNRQTLVYFPLASNDWWRISFWGEQTRPIGKLLKWGQAAVWGLSGWSNL